MLVAGAYPTVTGWLGSNDINPASAGALALTGTSSETINMGSYANLSLGASGAATYNGAITPAGTTYLFGGAGGTLTLASALTGSNSLTVVGPGTVVLTGTNNSYSGGTTLSGGTLQVGIVAALGSASAPLTVAGGILDLHGCNIGVGALSGTGTIDNLAGSSTSTLTAGNGNSTFSGVIQNTGGTVALAMAGTGTLALAGADT